MWSLPHALRRIRPSADAALGRSSSGDRLAAIAVRSATSSGWPTQGGQIRRHSSPLVFRKRKDTGVDLSTGPAVPYTATRNGPLGHNPFG